MKTDKEFEGWTQSDIYYAIERLVDRVEGNDIEWDEDGSYRLDMAEDIKLVNYSKLDSDDKWFEIQEIIAKYVLRWASFEVTYNPDKYCEKIVPNDDL